jgi:hypothetical protein
VLTASVLELPSISRPTPFGPDHGLDRLGPQQLEALLKLLGVRSEPPSVPFLIRLQRSFLRTVPFENLDIAWGIPLQLDVARAWSKVVERRRGGFCYELNTLFGWALLQLGFDVSLLSARVWRKAQRTWGPEFDHLVSNGLGVNPSVDPAARRLPSPVARRAGRPPPGPGRRPGPPLRGRSAR